MFAFRNTGGAHQQLTGLSGAKTITIPNNAQGIMAQALTQNIRFTLSGGGTPTSSKGFELKAGDATVFIAALPGDVLTFIEETSSATLEYEFGTVLQFAQMQVK